ncbi:hypothetical protein H2198_003757 [Neophaeococcomyces mojaviensis]|uniref:Uncharacterized protein n=1 Tax=Neophaeococcomyces mojaviensis TaxID=3383035 RepID=A0ACC3AAE9_9EURO|nr:hypothetical protein H2198_003757 [Knufia sp. JES_112]
MEFCPASLPPTTWGEATSLLQFHNLEAAAGYCRYHAHFIQVIWWLNRLLSLQLSDCVAVEEELNARGLIVRQSAIGTTNGTYKLRVEDVNILPHAYAICEALAVYSLPQYRHIGAIYMGMPARIAWQALPKDSPYALWIEDFMEAMAASSGFEVPRHVLREIQVKE